MPPANIERFNRIAATIFMKLYEEFPKRVDIDANKLSLEVFPDDFELQEMFDRMGITRDTLNWLEEENFITKQTVTMQHKYCGVRLTQKGLAILGMPNSIEEKDGTVADAMKDALSDTTRNAVSDVMKSLLVKAGASVLGLG